jgi:Ohr subfamily peroxiredoxin
LDVDLAVPADMGGSGGSGTNPEQLFAAGYGACFQSALMGAARREHLTADDSQVTARVGIGPIGEGTKTWGYGLTVRLQIHLPSVPDRKIAEALVARAHEICPYSNATRNNIPVELVVV